MTFRLSPLRIVLVAALLAVVVLGAFWALRANGPEDADADAKATIAAAGFSAEQEEAIGLMVRQYILEHPEVLPEAIAELQRRQTTEQLANAGDGLTKAFPGAVLGNPKGSKVLVEFSDYACGYCRQSVEDVKALVAADSDLQVVIREFPILSQGSVEAAKMALAAAKQGKFEAFHEAMYAQGRPTDDAIELAAKQAGLDMTRARADAGSEDVAKEIEANREFAQQLQISGTPAWIAGDQVMEGAVGQSALRVALYPEKR
ncbi:DsbA family protein [Croceicoccus sp. Ery15]|uniref:DsbA family protein n=1 Tax=Croceicoccus sp. Ery15 TaxID=1703338 RepID=UPI001E3A10F6|nr:DsbA family protein [Croceicoccus sp. Ery15]